MAVRPFLPYGAVMGPTARPLPILATRAFAAEIDHVNSEDVPNHVQVVAVRAKIGEENLEGR